MDEEWIESNTYLLFGCYSKTSMANDVENTKESFAPSEKEKMGTEPFWVFKSAQEELFSCS